MIKRWKHFILLLFLITLIASASVCIEAATPASKKLNARGTNTAYDITGDGKKDKIQFSHQGVGYGYNRMTIKVNGKTAFTQKSNWAYYDVHAYHLTLKNGKKYILYFSNGEHEIGDICGLLRWKNGKLTEEVNFGKLNNAGHYPGHFFSVKKFKLTNNQVRVWMEGSSSGLARFKVYADAAFSGSTMKLKATNIRFDNIKNWGSGYACGNTWYTTKKRLQGYKSYSGTAKSFVISGGTQVTLVKYYPSKKYNRILVKLKNGKTAWINDTFSGDCLFNELYYWA